MVLTYRRTDMYPIGLPCLPYTYQMCDCIHFQQSICCEAIPGCYELIMNKKVKLEKVCTKKVDKIGEKKLCLWLDSSLQPTLSLTTTSGRCCLSCGLLWNVAEVFSTSELQCAVVDKGKHVETCNKLCNIAR